MHDRQPLDPICENCAACRSTPFGGMGDILTLGINVPMLRNKRFTEFSLLLISRQTSSTVRIKLVSALMKMYSPSEFSALHSAAMRSPASWERPTKYTRGWRAYLANCLSVVSPIPLVAPTKTAIRPGGRVEGMREFEDSMSGRETMVNMGCSLSLKCGLLL